MNSGSAFLQFLMSVARVSTPLALAALAGLLSERSGVINIALEGMMLTSAFAAAVASHASGSALAGLAAGVAAGAAVAAVYGHFTVRWRADQIVAGTAINILAAGATPLLCKVLYDSTLATPSLDPSARFLVAPLFWPPMAAAAIWLWMKFSPSGAWLRFAGEKPKALDAAGIRVNRVRGFAVIASGALAGVSGATLSIFLSSGFTRNMTAGRGFMAIAALVFGRWRPFPALLACVFFGVTESLQYRLQGVVLWGEQPVPVQFIQILPYVVTLLVLAGWGGHSRAPAALGSPFRKGEA